MSFRSGKYVHTGLHILLFSVSNYSVFYEDWSFMMDEERSSMIPTMAAGINAECDFIVERIHSGC